jgi:hypothetical protein
LHKITRYRFTILLYTDRVGYGEDPASAEKAPFLDAPCSFAIAQTAALRHIPSIEEPVHPRHLSVLVEEAGANARPLRWWPPECDGCSTVLVRRLANHWDEMKRSFELQRNKEFASHVWTEHPPHRKHETRYFDYRIMIDSIVNLHV